MATRYVNTASTAGGDGTTNATSGANRAYATMAAWEAARQGTLTEIEEVICEGTAADTTAVDIDGWTTTSAFYIDIKALASATAGRHTGVWSTSKYRLSPSLAFGVAIVVREVYTRITGILVENRATDPNAAIYFDTGVNASGADDCLVDSVIGQIPSATTYNRNVFTSLASRVNYRNCIAIGNGTTTGAGFSGGFGGAGAARLVCYNCIAVYGQYGFRAGSGSNPIIWTNCYAAGSGTADFSGQSAGPITTCASEDGTESTTVVAYTTANFTNITVGTENFRLPFGSALRNVGTNLSGTFTTDAAGAPRNGIWEIGPFNLPGTVYVDPNATAGGNGYSNALTGENRAFSSLNAWEAARQHVLIEIEDVICSTNGGAADSNNVTIDGWTTTAAFYVDIKTDPAYRHAGVWDDTKYRITITAGSIVVGGTEDFTRVTGLQVSVGHAGDTSGGINLIGTATMQGCHIVGNIVRSTVAAISVGIWITANLGGSSHNFIVNNIVYGFTGVGGIGIYGRTNTSARVYVYNNTCYGNHTGFRPRDGFFIAKNTLAIGNTTSWFAVADSGSTHNAYDQGTDPGVSGINLSASTDAQIFVDAASNNYLLVSASHAADIASDLSRDANLAVFTDILGNYRRYIWDVGAHEQGATSTAILTRYVNTGSSAGGNGTTNATTGANRAYQSLSAWESARQATLTVVEEVLCEGTAADTTAVFVDGWVTTATSYIDIKASTAGRHAGVYSATKYRIEVTNATALTSLEQHLRITGVQAKVTVNATGNFRAFLTDSAGVGAATNVQLEACIAVGVLSGTLSNCQGFYINDSATAKNCLSYDWINASETHQAFRMWPLTAATINLYNCTAQNSNLGYARHDGAVAATNCGAASCTTGFSGSITQTTCSSTAPTFVNAAGDDFHLAAGDTTWKDQGTNLSGTFTLDIDGDTRSAPWDIGADESLGAAIIAAVMARWSAWR